MAGPTYRIEPRGECWTVLTVGGKREPARGFATLDQALRWCERQEPAAIRLPDAFIPSLQGSGFEVSAGHTPRED